MTSQEAVSHPAAENPPHLVFALPGPWAGVSLREDEALSANMSMLRSSGLDARVIDELTEHLRLSEKAGADRLLIRQSRKKPTVLITGWPGTAPTNVPALRSELDQDAAAVGVESRTGYSVLRTRETVAKTDGEGVTYWVVHPVTGQVLTVGILFLFGAPSERDIEVYDMVIANLSWEEASDE